MAAASVQPSPDDEHGLVGFTNPEVVGVVLSVQRHDPKVAAVLLAILAHRVDEAQCRLAGADDRDPRQRCGPRAGHRIA